MAWRDGFRGERVWEDLDGLYPMRTDIEGLSHSKFRPRVKKRLTRARWKRAFDDLGRWHDMDRVLRHIQRGGVEPGVRAEVWEFLLGVFPADSTSGERQALRKHRREVYAEIKKQCATVDPLIGSGVVVDFPRVREDGSPIAPPVRVTNGLSNQPSASARLPAGMSNGAVDHGSVSAASEETRQKKVKTSESGGSNGGASGGAAAAAAAAAAAGGGEGTGRRTAALLLPPVAGIPDAMLYANGGAGGGGAAVVVEETGGSLPGVPLERIHRWRYSLHQIGVDVLRTDRSLAFYEEAGNRARLMDLLAAYAWLDPDVGYCQGMSDLMSPMVVLFPDEADAFWCFERLMRRIRNNFKGSASAIGVQQQLSVLSNIIVAVDPPLHAHLESVGAGSFFFVVRMMMVLFRRELTFADTLYFWEMLWAMDYDPVMAASTARQEPPHLAAVDLLASSSSSPAALPPLPLPLPKAGGIQKGGVGRYRKDTVRYAAAMGKDALSTVDDGEERPVTFCVAALIVQVRVTLLEDTRALDEVMKVFNEAAKEIDLKMMCKRAIALHKKYLSLRKQEPAAVEE
eukprot:jgi/Mesen1/2492/ME000159S01622